MSSPLDSDLKFRLLCREERGLLRKLKKNQPIDFSSNDYLGLSRRLNEPRNSPSGSTGSRLLTGHSDYIDSLEETICRFHSAEAGLIFNSGYDANLGLLASLGSEQDTILLDSQIHASMRDGAKLSRSPTYFFRHNDINHLENRLQALRAKCKNHLFVAVESLYSMSGDLAPLKEIVQLCEQYNAYLIVDEAHATGIIGEQGEGLVSHQGLQKRVAIRVHTFGKALGSHGAIVLGSKILRNFLLNHAHSFMYSTALPPASLCSIEDAYRRVPLLTAERTHLRGLIEQIQTLDLPGLLTSETPIQSLLIPGNEAVRKAAQCLQDHGFDVRPILSPTVRSGEEILRICLHAFNTKEELQMLISLLKNHFSGALT
jgi:8-amino-7-oxononanoate synthase